MRPRRRDGSLWCARFANFQSWAMFTWQGSSGPRARMTGRDCGRSVPSLSSSPKLYTQWTKISPPSMQSASSSTTSDSRVGNSPLPISCAGGCAQSKRGIALQRLKSSSEITWTGSPWSVAYGSSWKMVRMQPRLTLARAWDNGESSNLTSAKLSLACTALSSPMMNRAMQTSNWM